MTIRKDFKAEKAEPKKKKKRERTILTAAKGELKKSFSWGFFGKVALLVFGIGVFFFFVVRSGDFLREWVASFMRQKFISQFSEEGEIARTAPPEEKSSVPTAPIPVEREDEKIPEAPKPVPEKPAPFFKILPPSEVGERKDMVFSSFSDLFSGVGWLNQSETTMYHDKSVTAFTFRPLVRWTKKADVPVIPAVSRTRRCIAASCLSSDDSEIFLNGTRLELPGEVKDAKIESISIGALETRWVVGITILRAGQYEGWVYSFDGNDFLKVFGEANTPFISKYKGTFGFGGTDDEWLVIYGGYRGLGYFIREGRPFQDISSMLSYRIMDGGFDPVVIPAGEGGATRFYVSSASDGKSRLIKFFKNPAGEIAGVVDFSESIRGQFSRVTFRVTNIVGNVAVLEAAATTPSGETSGWEIIDEGFDEPSVAEVYSVNINNYPAEVRSATIAEVQMDEGNATAKFFVSNDGNTWIEAPVGKEIFFPKTDGTRLLWKVEFILSGNRSPLFSPYFDKIRIDYKVKFL